MWGCFRLLSSSGSRGENDEFGDTWVMECCEVDIIAMSLGRSLVTFVGSKRELLIAIFFWNISFQWVWPISNLRYCWVVSMMLFWYVNDVSNEASQSYSALVFWRTTKLDNFNKFQKLLSRVLHIDWSANTFSTTTCNGKTFRRTPSTDAFFTKTDRIPFNLNLQIIISKVSMLCRSLFHFPSLTYARQSSNIVI